MSQNQAHRNIPTSQGTRLTPMILPVALVHVFCCVYQQYNSQRKSMLARANMYRICTPTLLLVHYIPHTKYASRSSSRPQGLYMPLAKLCKAFAGAEDFIPCSQTRRCQRCCQCDYSSIGTVATWANRPEKKRSTTAISQQQKIKEEVHGLC